MSERSAKRAPLWVKGAASPNPSGRPKGTGKPISRLRSTLKKLQEMEKKALENIQDSVNGKDVDKEVLATSKWVVTTAVAVNRAATADEAFRHDLKKDQEEVISSIPPKPRFSTSILRDEE